MSAADPSLTLFLGSGEEDEQPFEEAPDDVDDGNVTPDEEEEGEELIGDDMER